MRFFRPTLLVHMLYREVQSKLVALTWTKGLIEGLLSSPVGEEELDCCTMS